MAAGLTADEVRQRVRSGRWRRLVNGVYSRGPAPEHDGFAAERRGHVERCVAAVRRHPGAAIGFGSAAIALGLPLISGVPALGQVITAPGGWTGIRDGIRYRTATCPHDQIVCADVHGVGMSVAMTSPARTLADIARTLARADAVAAGDAALRLCLATRGDAQAILQGMRRMRGCRTGREVTEFWDARRETALESWSAHRFWEWGLPVPTPQVEFHDEEGFIGRVDFYWEEFGLIGEADGRLKYTSSDVLYAEKRREDRLRSCAGAIIRWGWEDLRFPRAAALRDRLSALLR
jgi:hypothetical protein